MALRLESTALPHFVFLAGLKKTGEKKKKSERERERTTSRAGVAVTFERSESSSVLQRIYGRKLEVVGKKLFDICDDLLALSLSTSSSVLMTDIGSRTRALVLQSNSVERT